MNAKVTIFIRKANCGLHIDFISFSFVQFYFLYYCYIIADIYYLLNIRLMCITEKV